MNPCLRDGAGSWGTSEPVAWGSDTRGGSSYQASHQIVKFSWRRQAWPQWTDTPGFPSRECFLSQYTLVNRFFRLMVDRRDMDLILILSPPQSILKDSQVDDRNVDYPWQAGTCSLSLPKPAGLARHNWGENFVLTPCVCIIFFLFHSFLADFKIKSKFLDHVPFNMAFLFLYF